MNRYKLHEPKKKLRDFAVGDRVMLSKDYRVFGMPQRHGVITNIANKPTHGVEFDVRWSDWSGEVGGMSFNLTPWHVAHEPI